MSEFFPIKGYEDYYGINRDGEVISHYYGIVLKHGVSAGYPAVGLYKPGRKCGRTTHIHRLLAEQFIPNPKELPIVNHINGDIKDHRLENLEWVTPQYNVRDGYNRGRVAHNKGMKAEHLKKACNQCSEPFVASRKTVRFCSTSCSAKWRIVHYPHTIERERDPINGRIKQGVLTHA
jgi:hypothetical protein